jgi:hypothetical protein
MKSIQYFLQNFNLMTPPAPLPLLVNDGDIKLPWRMW